jgi:hypothetical protein
MSDDYTPTTAEVRAVYASGSFVQTGPNTYDIDEERGLAEFDRMLAEHDKYVEEQRLLAVTNGGEKT